ncbi:MAG TPA: nuclear transport factor 2 family protein [Solirubrobacteraceae bacterium]|nr:nuclear transport factor 2 family protein [Solirubrobacteraceae bacterium]
MRLETLTAPTGSATEVMTEYLASAKRGDWDAAYAFFAEDMIAHVPGRSAFAGEHHGREAAIAYIQSIRDHYMNGGIELELVDMLVSEERVALIVRERFFGDGPPVTIRRANVYRVREGEIVEISIFEADQYEADALVGEIVAA